MFGFGWKSQRVCVWRFPFFFFFFFYACQWVGDKVTVHGTHNHFIKKKFKNGSFGTIHTFKNYFATLFLVFSKISCIQMDPNYHGIRGSLMQLSPNNLNMWKWKWINMLDILRYQQLSVTCSRTSLSPFLVVKVAWLG